MTQVIGTHDGSFHADEIVAISLLKQLPTYSSATIRRSRSPEVWQQCQILVDVGGVYNPDRHHYDHHQRDFQQTYPGSSILLSSAGLIYLHFADEIIDHKFTSIPSPQKKRLKNIIYYSYIQALDAIDTGTDRVPAEITPNYFDHTDLSSRINLLNHHRNVHDHENQMKQFLLAVKQTSQECQTWFSYGCLA